MPTIDQWVNRQRNRPIQMPLPTMPKPYVHPLDCRDTQLAENARLKKEAMSPLRPAGGLLGDIKGLVELTKLASDLLHGRKEIVFVVEGIELPPISMQVREKEGDGP